MPAESKNIADEAKGFSQNLVNSLGLNEIILGVVGLYILWLIFLTSELNSLFPSTGISIVDVGLQLFFAALVGKVVCFIVDIPISIVRILMKLIWEDKFTRLANALKPFYLDNQIELENYKFDLIERSINFISSADNNQRNNLQQLQTKLVFAFASSLLAFLYCFKPNLPSNWWWVAFVLGFLFLILGIFEQLVLIRELTHSLESLYIQKKEKASSKSTGTVPKDGTG
jgi:hypothetical protein